MQELFLQNRIVFKRELFFFRTCYIIHYIRGCNAREFPRQSLFGSVRAALQKAASVIILFEKGCPLHGKGTVNAMLLNSILAVIRGESVDPISVVVQLLATLVIVILVLPFHEFAHGWVAYKLGDPTAKLAGRLTFNPLASVDPIGAAALLLVGFGWAKPVPVDSRYFKNPRSGMALTALAGPVANLLASYIGCLLFYAVALFAPSNTFVYYVLVFLQYYAFINAVLAVFNLVPIPPLDGSKILAAFLSDRARYTFYQYQNILATIGMIILFSSVLDGPISALQNTVFSGVSWLASLPFQLFGVL